MRDLRQQIALVRIILIKLPFNLNLMLHKIKEMHDRCY